MNSFTAWMNSAVIIVFMCVRLSVCSGDARLRRNLFICMFHALRCPRIVLGVLIRAIPFLRSRWTGFQVATVIVSESFYELNASIAGANIDVVVISWSRCTREHHE